ncbi:MAG: hypothetical protein WA970_17810 [Gammaproteobacteria bacterium]
MHVPHDPWTVQMGENDHLYTVDPQLERLNQLILDRPLLGTHV